MSLKLIIGILILIGLQINIGFGQNIYYEQYKNQNQNFAIQRGLLNNYKEFSSTGNYKDEKRVGLWQDISIDSIVYRKGEYSNDKPIGLWKIYYPDGMLRMSFSYDNYGNLQKWSRYYNDVKIVEISFSNKTSPSLISSFFEYEKLLFIKESNQYETNVTHTQGRLINSYTWHTSYIDVVEVLNGLITLIKLNKGSCGIDYWHQNGLLWKRSSFSNGAECYKVSFQYRNKKLKRKRFFKSEKLIKIETYDKKGNKTEVY